MFALYLATLSVLLASSAPQKYSAVQNIIYLWAEKKQYEHKRS